MLDNGNRGRNFRKYWSYIFSFKMYNWKQKECQQQLRGLVAQLDSGISFACRAYAVS